MTSYRVVTSQVGISLKTVLSDVISGIRIIRGNAPKWNLLWRTFILGRHMWRYR